MAQTTTNPAVRGSSRGERRAEVRTRPTRPSDFPAIVEMSRRVYPDEPPWTVGELASHLEVFPEGQLVAVVEDPETGEETVVGMAASLILSWDEYEVGETWRGFTDHGLFTNHDPAGRTLYGAEVMVDPRWQGLGVGSALYRARRELARRLGLSRIRAGARLRSYHRHAGRLSAREYVDEVVAGELRDPTLSFQLNRGFRVIQVVSSYLREDPKSLGWAAVIEWLDPEAG